MVLCPCLAGRQPWSYKVPPPALCQTLCDPLTVSPAGLKNPNRPIASFIFSGPTGVGKSELAKTLATYYFGSQEAMVRLDMSEFMERHTVSKLIGSPPGEAPHQHSVTLWTSPPRHLVRCLRFSLVCGTWGGVGFRVSAGLLGGEH